MGLIESYGTGVRKIIDLYSEFEKKPLFEAAPGAFKVTLYNMNVNDSKVKNSNSIPLMKETKINTIKIKN